MKYELFEEIYAIAAPDIIQDGGTCCTASPESVIIFLSDLEGIKTRGKNLHWAAPEMNSHKLMDELISEVDEFEDSIAEDYMGITNKLSTNAINGNSCDATDASTLLEYLQCKVINFYNSLPDDVAWKGISSECETFIHTINKFSYLFTLTGK